MNSIKSFYIVVISVMVIILGVPSLIVIAFDSNGTNQNTKNISITTSSSTTPTKTETESITVSVYRTSFQEVEKIGLEEYIKGVLAAEMPASYELEALKAQAISARTYFVRFLLTEKKDQAPQVPQGADITDSTQHQVYKNQDELKEMWQNDDYDKYIMKITQAVNETEGLIMTYNGELIDASFFAISNGYTENSEDYWSASLPYLRSVPSPWDKNSPDFINEKEVSSKEFQTNLGVKLSSDISVKRTSTNRVSTISIAGKEFTGDEFRKALGLRSTDFSFKIVDDTILFTTTGYGHGVGMSQYGANSMAKEGKSYKEILKYYYKGIKIEDMKPNEEYNDKLVVKS
ncbi:stage II sporulation protein D [Metabacillus litoralis]|uniref:stage II sporulation protein D n=1 Tax=Metabacillus litoralis TaxID=152268 RepID=UPI00203F0161|nr:stage II sporulation protein D [Metabacillus litoralis]MCM3412684.1 stage II sporulation protein D [Metabacillus litoralis]